MSVPYSEALRRPEDLSGRDRYGFAPVAITPAGAALAFVAGQVPDDPAADFPEQARQVFAHVGAALAVAGTTTAMVASIRCLVVDLTAERLHQLSSARREFFGIDLPTSTVIAVPRLVGEGLLLEVDAIAVLAAGVTTPYPSVPILPLRQGPRPGTTSPTGLDPVPHAQLEQNATSALQDELHRRAARLPGVSSGDSQVSVPGARAWHLDPDQAHGPAESFQAGTEFGHIHPAHDGSLHLALPAAARAQVLAGGWGEPHPLSGTMLVFGPRDEEELEVVWSLIHLSHAFASGSDRT